MDIQEINRAIIAGNFTATELDSIQDAVRFARGKTAKMMGRVLRAGDSVKITHAKLGGTVFGTVRKIKIKKADVFIPSQNVVYNVPLAMLEAA